MTKKVVYSNYKQLEDMSKIKEAKLLHYKYANLYMVTSRPIISMHCFYFDNECHKLFTRHYRFEFE